MTPFAYSRPAGIDEAVALAGPHSRFIAGGTNLVDLMKEEVERPERLIDINALPLREIRDTDAGGLSVGALVDNASLAAHPQVTARYPLISRAILAGASPQLRNMASTGGNLLQRTRCHYFYDRAVPCNKREPGSGCPARDGLNRQHAILGASEHCVAVHPSDLCVALAALNALVHVRGPQAHRCLTFEQFHRLPGSRPQEDNILAADELVLGIELPGEGFPQHCAYLKVRDRASYAFALVSVAVGLLLDGDGRIAQVNIALGGVAHKPWRDAEAEDLLLGCRPEATHFQRCADHLLRGARPLRDNAFKIELARRSIVRALHMAAGGAQ
ncbi:FAD binding domain-containing protein [Pseudomonas sp. NY15437]|uniref:FAD binding domain-containing protein n=1 Tax=Pseudomonas sp. NY15437 TaxID=3400360 RepID=UPI003A8B6C90